LGKKDELWIHKLKPGTFRRYLYNTFGKDAFTNAGKIKISVINGIMNAYNTGKKYTLGKVSIKPTLRTFRRANAAKTLRKLRKKK